MKVSIMGFSKEHCGKRLSSWLVKIVMSHRDCYIMLIMCELWGFNCSNLNGTEESVFKMVYMKVSFLGI